MYGLGLLMASSGDVCAEGKVEAKGFPLLAIIRN